MKKCPEYKKGEKTTYETSVFNLQRQKYFFFFFKFPFWWPTEDTIPVSIRKSESDKVKWLIYSFVVFKFLQPRQDKCFTH